MPNKTDKTKKSHETELMHMIPYIEHEYELYKVSKLKNRIVRALAVTTAVLIGLLLACFISR